MRIVISGPPSVGKTTQGTALAEYLGVPHLSSGDAIRDGARSGDPQSIRLAAMVADGSLAPSGPIVEMVLSRLSMPDCEGGFVVAGFPRRVEEAKALVRRYGVDGIDAYVVLDAGVDALMDRVSERARQATFVRDDDDPAFFPGRVATYLAETRPVREFMRTVGVPVVAIDANPSEDDVQDALRAAMAELGLAPDDADLAPAFF